MGYSDYVREVQNISSEYIKGVREVSRKDSLEGNDMRFAVSGARCANRGAGARPPFGKASAGRCPSTL